MPPSPLRLAIRWILVAATTLSSCWAPCARAEDGPDAPAARRQRLMTLDREVTRCFAEKRYEEAEARVREQIALAPEEDRPWYNLACALARQGKKGAALEALKAAVEHGWADASHMEADPDLEPLRGESGWAEVLAQTRAAEERDLEVLYDEPTKVEGTTVLEGSPRGGLAWRLRLAPAATPKARHRLLVWLHPSGGSMNAAVEALAPRFAEQGFALLVPTKKRWGAWTEEDARRLLEGTLPDVAKVDRVDAAKPVLMGFSAGGQMAIEFWHRRPEAWGGLVLDAAYPVDADAYAAGQVRARALPEGEGARAVPVFAIVGDADGGSMLWRQVEEGWRAAGLPLTLRFVPGGRHEWLLDGDEVPPLLAWLGEVRAGRRPSARPPLPPAAPGAGAPR